MNKEIQNSIDPGSLFELITTFCRLDPEHQRRAVSALDNVLADQITEIIAGKPKAI